MATLTDHDERQLRRMAERLQLFSDGQLTLRVLIADLEFLINQLEAVDESTRRELREHWETLEEVYSVAVTMHGETLDAQAESLITSALAALQGRLVELGPFTRQEGGPS